MMKLPGLYLPAAQLTQVPLYSRANPALHVHDADLAGEFSSIPQVWQLSSVPEPYFPTSHMTHVPPWARENPALQMQLLKSVLPAKDTELAGHRVHVSPYSP